MNCFNFCGSSIAIAVSSAYLEVFFLFKVNSDNTPGAIGFQTRILPFVYPVTLIRVNEETGELMRDKDGLCMRCEPGTIYRPLLIF